MLWLAGGFFLFLRYLAKSFNNKYMWWTPYALLTLGVFAFAFATVPLTDISAASVVSWLFGYVFDFLAYLTGVSGSVIAGVVLLCLLLAGLRDLIKDRKPDGWATTLVYTAPVLALLASGPLAPHILELIHTIGGIGPTVITTVAA